VDGTIPFSHGIPICVFSLALVRNGVPIVGIVYDPFMDRMYTAEKGLGAHLNGAPIHVSDKGDFARGLIGIGYVKNQVNLLGVIGALADEWGICVQFCTNIYMSVLVGAGEFLATFFAGKLPWDVAAVKVIVEEAGGKVTDLDGNEQRYDREINGALISNGRVHDWLLGLVKQYAHTF
jgi:fructose-1,6-bisphosphatase/inositol monophosphatase family enzyme